MGGPSRRGTVRAAAVGDMGPAIEYRNEPWAVDESIRKTLRELPPDQRTRMYLSQLEGTLHTGAYYNDDGERVKLSSRQLKTLEAKIRHLEQMKKPEKKTPVDPRIREKHLGQPEPWSERRRSAEDEVVSPGYMRSFGKWTWGGGRMNPPHTEENVGITKWPGQSQFKVFWKEKHSGRRRETSFHDTEEAALMKALSHMDPAADPASESGG